MPASRDRDEYIQPNHLRRIRSAGRRCLLAPHRRFESALDAIRSGNRGQIFETRSDNAPPDMRAIPKAPHHPAAESFAAKTCIKKASANGVRGGPGAEGAGCAQKAGTLGGSKPLVCEHPKSPRKASFSFELDAIVSTNRSVCHSRHTGPSFSYGVLI